MDKRNILALTVVTGLVLNTSGCLYGKWHWRGWGKRPVLVSVADKSSNHPIPAAIVKLVPSAHMEERAKGQGLKYTAASNNNGLAELLVEFPAGGVNYMFVFTKIKEKGSFGLDGRLQVTAKGYQDFEEPLASLVGRRSLSTQDKSPVKVTADLTRLN